MNEYHLAQLNIAKMIADIEDPIMKDFVDNLEGVNSIADNSPGFVWRFESEEGDATNMRVFEDNLLLVNMSVWESIEDLKNFVYGYFHLEILKRKKEWLNKFDGIFQVMWLKYLQAKGESELAFGFRQSFAPSAQHLDLPTE
jgi:hypothetical protein